MSVKHLLYFVSLLVQIFYLQVALIFLPYTEGEVLILTLKPKEKYFVLNSQDHFLPSLSFKYQQHLTFLKVLSS